MDQVGREERGAGALTYRPLDHSRRLLRPMRFDPPALTPVLTPEDLADRHADQLAAAVAVAREEGLRAARAEVDAAVAHHEAAADELRAAAAALRSALADLDRRDAAELDELQHQAVLFGASVAEELIGRELRSVDDVVLAAVERAITMSPDRGDVSIRLHPADLDVVQRYVTDTGGSGDRIRLVPDAHVARGGCIANVGALRIDAQLPAALARVQATLEG